MHDGGLLSRADADAAIDELQRNIHRMQRALRLAIEQHLAQFSGLSLETLANNREVAQRIHELLDAHGLRVRCGECGHPAILRVSPRPGIPQGVFVFDHTIDGRRTFHGGKRTVPEIRLTNKPPRRSATREAG